MVKLLVAFQHPADVFLEIVPLLGEAVDSARPFLGSVRRQLARALARAVVGEHLAGYQLQFRALQQRFHK
jgi:hypothetical protein